MSEPTPPAAAAPIFDPARSARLMQDAGIDLLLASRRASVAYLTDSSNILYWRFPDVAHCLEIEDDGCEAPFYFAGLPADFQAASFAATHGNRPLVFGENWIRDIKIWCGRRNISAADVLVDAISERGLQKSTIGIEMNALPAGIIDDLRRRLPDARFVEGRGVLWGMRSVKTTAEIERLSHAYRIAEDIYDRVIQAIRAQPGITVAEIRALEMAMVTRAGCPPLHFGYVYPHGPHKTLGGPDTEKLRIEPGDAIFLDIGVIWRGYTTDFGRNLFFGKAPADLRDVYDRTVECRQRLVERLRPGARVCDVFAAGCAIREKLKLPPRELLGHSLGIECHEQPALSAAYDTVIEEGMVFVPELFETAGPYAFLLEDAGVVTANGWQSLTRMSTELIEL